MTTTTLEAPVESPVEREGDEMATATVEPRTAPKTALRRSEAARMLGVHPNTILSWARQGRLETIEFPNEVRYSEESVQALYEQIYGANE